MADVRIIPLGVGDAFSSRFYSTCLAVGVDDTWILVDCPHPIRKMIREGMHSAGLPYLEVDKFAGVVLSHLHADHASGLEDMGFYVYFIARRRLKILAHPEISKDLWDGSLWAGMGISFEVPGEPAVVRHFEEFFDLTDLSYTEPVNFGPFQIECRRTFHTVPTNGFRITVAGKTLGFSGDTMYDPGLIEWLSPCDMIIHEVTGMPVSNIHTPYALLKELPEDLRKKMRLNHLPDSFDLATSAIEPLQQGRIYTL
ncbi:MAG: MBL fold metallo-hydrolase [Isosphaeraceae bacterium]